MELVEESQRVEQTQSSLLPPVVPDVVNTGFGTDIQRTVALDLDGVLAKVVEPFDPDVIGPCRAGAASFTSNLHRARFRILVYTCRVNLISTRKKVIGEIGVWLRSNSIFYDSIWDVPGKPFAHAYVDDRAVTVICEPGENDWDETFLRVTQLARITGAYK